MEATNVEEVDENNKDSLLVLREAMDEFLRGGGLEHGVSESDEDLDQLVQLASDMRDPFITFRANIIQPVCTWSHKW